jgi:hypothetical protein
LEECERDEEIKRTVRTNVTGPLKEHEGLASITIDIISIAIAVIFMQINIAATAAFAAVDSRRQMPLCVC